MVNRTLVKALRAVFTSSFDEPEFRDINISTEFPIKRVQYPAIHVRFNGGAVTNAGVGHKELFYDSAGKLRWWMHRKFTGSVDFVVYALSPVSRDILTDTLHDILSFGTLNSLPNEFFEEIYGDPDDAYSMQSLLNQLSVNTDEITSGGKSAGLAPWAPEDVLVYQASYNVELGGGFYNTVPTTAGLEWAGNYSLKFYDSMDNYPADDGPAWSHPFVHEDEEVVTGVFTFSNHADEAPVIGRMEIFSIGADTKQSIDAAAVTGYSVIAKQWEYIRLDAGTVTGTAVPSTAAEFHDRYTTGTVTGVAVPSDAQLFSGLDAATVTGIGTAHQLFTDAATVAGVFEALAEDIYDSIDAATFTAVATPAADERREYPADAATITGVAVPTTTFESRSGDDGSTVTGTAVPSATDLATNNDAGTVTGIAAPSGVDTFTLALADAGTVAGVSIAKFAPYDRLKSFSPVAAWRFDDASSSEGSTLADSVGTYPGTYQKLGTGSVPSVQQSGAYYDGTSKAAFFDSSDASNGGYATVPYNTAHNAAQFTISMWVKPTLLGVINYIWSQYYFTAGRGTVSYIDFANKPYFVMYGTGGSGILTVLSSTAVTLNNWHHIAFSYDASALKVYLNGVETGSTSAAGFTHQVNNARPTRIGAQHDTSGNVNNVARDAYFDEVAYFNSALSAYAIGSIYEHGVQGSGIP